MPAEQATPEATRDLKGMLNTILAAIESLSSSYPVMGEFVYLVAADAPSVTRLLSASRAEKVRAELVGAGLR